VHVYVVVSKNEKQREADSNGAMDHSVEAAKTQDSPNRSRGVRARFPRRVPVKIQTEDTWPYHCVIKSVPMV